MRRWSSYLWRALTALGETGCPWDLGYLGETRHAPKSFVDHLDDASVHATFRSIMEREWGAAAFEPAPPRRRPGSPGNAF
jgi:hypothetical protein